MITWIFMLIPVFVAAILLIFWTKKIVWWEIALLVLPTSLIILLLNFAMVSYNTSDTEYLGSYTKTVTYYEPWDEEVPCRHPIYCTRMVSYSCGTSKSPRTCFRTERYICGYVHPYDVDYHPARWAKENNFGSENGISQGEFNMLKKRFNTKEYFVELNRDYHSIDGNAYSTDWDELPEHSDVSTTSGSYTNKIRASHSVFKFQDISEKQKKVWKLYEYPEISGGYQPVVLGKKVDFMTDRRLQYINGFYGPHKQFKMFILFFKNQSMSVVHKQRSLWEGGNKNEFVVCIGVDGSGKFEWVDAFSWMDRPELEVEVEDYFNTTGDVKLNEFSKWMPEQVHKHWKRKDFDDFKYLQMELTDSQLWWVMLIVMLYNCFISIWAVKNEHGNESIVDNFSTKFDAIIDFIVRNTKLAYQKTTAFISKLIYKQ